MNITKLVVRRKKNGPLIISLVFFGYCLLSLGLNEEKAFNWLHTNFEGKLAMMLGMSFVIYLILRYIHSIPQLVINDTGIQAKKFIFFNERNINWENIYYYYFEDVKDFNKNIKLLGIKLKVPEKEIQVDLKGLDKSIEEIAEVIEPFSKKFGFHKLL